MKQIEAILTHLKTKGSITPLDALMNFGCFRLGARIFELREQGHDIETERVTDKGKNYARYNYRNGELRQQQFFTP